MSSSRYVIIPDSHPIYNSLTIQKIEISVLLPTESYVIRDISPSAVPTIKHGVDVTLYCFLMVIFSILRSQMIFIIHLASCMCILVIHVCVLNVPYLHSYFCCIKRNMLLLCGLCCLCCM